MTNIEGVEIRRFPNPQLYGNEIRETARVIMLCEHLPVTQVENGVLVLYAIRPGLIRKLTREKKSRKVSNG